MKTVIFLILVAGLLAVDFKGITVKEAKRTIDASEHIVEFSTVYTVEVSEGQDHFVFKLLKDHSANLAIVTAKYEKTELSVIKLADMKGEDFDYFSVKLPENEKSLSLTISGKLLHQLQPYPKEIKQGENQYVVYRDSAYVILPYKCEKQTTTVKVGTSVIETYTQVGASKTQGKTIKYGPYENIDANTYEPIKIHFLNNSPFMTANRILKEVEVSLWGNVAVEEIYSVEHSGAKLVGPFSRLDYDMKRNNDESPDWIKLEGEIPKVATDVYYRDVIGNISSSHLRYEGKYQSLELEMRFPMFGGWKNEFYIGYNLPISQYVTSMSKNKNRHTLAINFGPAIDNLAINDYTVRFILPEGARDIKYNYKYRVEKENGDGDGNERRYTYLDSPFEGRPVIQFKRQNVVDDYDQIFEISYTLTLPMWREPLMIVGSFFTIFLFASLFRYLS